MKKNTYTLHGTTTLEQDASFENVKGLKDLAKLIIVDRLTKSKAIKDHTQDSEAKEYKLGVQHYLTAIHMSTSGDTKPPTKTEKKMAAKHFAVLLTSAFTIRKDGEVISKKQEIRLAEEIDKELTS